MDTYNQIESALQARHHPIISMQAGANHAVVAYNIEDDPNTPGAYYIDVYDCNRPEEGETTVAAHVQTETDSRIHIGPGDGWSFKMQDGSIHQGGFDTLEVYSASLAANGVTLPNNIFAIVSGGVLTVIFGSAGSTASASTTQAAAPSIVGPAAQRDSDAMLFLPPHDDLARQLAQARATPLARLAPCKPASLVDLELTVLGWLGRVAVNPQPLPPGG
jgi:hypothetical protein